MLETRHLKTTPSADDRRGGRHYRPKGGRYVGGHYRHPLKNRDSGHTEGISSRSMPDYDAAVASFDAVTDERLAQLEPRCPARIPMRAVAALVRAKAAQVRRPTRDA